MRDVLAFNNRYLGIIANDRAVDGPASKVLFIGSVPSMAHSGRPVLLTIGIVLGVVEIVDVGVVGVGARLVVIAFAGNFMLARESSAIRASLWSAGVWYDRCDSVSMENSAQNLREGTVKSQMVNAHSS